MHELLHLVLIGFGIEPYVGLVRIKLEVKNPNKKSLIKCHQATLEPYIIIVFLFQDARWS